MWWILVYTDDYGEHFSVDSSEEYVRALYKRLADSDAVYSVELFCTELKWQVCK